MPSYSTCSTVNAESTKTMKQYEDLINTIGASLCVSVLSVSMGQLITIYYFYYMMAILVLILTAATIYHHKTYKYQSNFQRVPKPMGHVERALVGAIRSPHQRTSFHGFSTKTCQAGESPERRRAWSDELRGHSLNTMTALHNHLSVPLCVSSVDGSQQVNKKKYFSSKQKGGNKRDLRKSMRLMKTK